MWFDAAGAIAGRVAFRKGKVAVLLNVLAVGCGGFIGATLRYLATLLTGRAAYATIGAASFPFPIGILLVNFVGCFLMGLLALWLPQRFPGNTQVLLFVTTGCLGGFTTLSTFGLDTWKLFAGGEVLPGLLNVVLTLAVCLGGVGAGVALARSL